MPNIPSARRFHNSSSSPTVLLANSAPLGLVACFLVSRDVSIVFYSRDSWDIRGRHPHRLAKPGAFLASFRHRYRAPFPVVSSRRRYGIWCLIPRIPSRLRSTFRVFSTSTSHPTAHRAVLNYRVPLTRAALHCTLGIPDAPHCECPWKRQGRTRQSPGDRLLLE